MNTETDTPTPTLKATDRCDQGCGAAAKVAAKGLQGELHFCGHHFNKHEEAVRAWAFDVIDERHITPPPNTQTF